MNTRSPVNLLFAVLLFANLALGQFQNHFFGPNRIPPNQGQFNQNQFNQYVPNRGNSVTIECGRNGQQCAGMTITCLSESCKYECFDPSSCANTRFVTSPMTKEIDVQCKKPNACLNVKLISSAAITKMQCEDHSCVATKVYCRSSFGELCELKCQSDGCVPQILEPYLQGMPNHVFRQPAAPKLNLVMFANELFCSGMYRECKVAADNHLAFLHGKFTCATTMGICLLECADSVGEVSCKGATYTCKTAPQNCLCYDQRRARMMYGGFTQQTPITYDCPKITYPKAKTKSKSKGKSKGKGAGKGKGAKKVVKKPKAVVNRGTAGGV